MTIDRLRVQKILVIKLRAIGDVLLSTAVLKNIRDAFPKAQIDFLTEKPSADVVDGNPYIDSVTVFDCKRKSGIGLIADVRKRKYDLIIDLFGNPRSALVTLFSGAIYRVGYRFNWRQFCYNIIVSPRGGDVHNFEFNLDALRAINIEISDSTPIFPIDETAKIRADQFFQREDLKGHYIVALNPGGGWSTKRWRLPQFAQLGDRIVQKYQAKILILWGPGEEGDARQIQQRMKSRATIIPPSTLKELGAILQGCTALVTNDSGPMHIASALGKPVTAIFGPTRPELQGPLGNNHIIVRNENIDCLGCNLTKCKIGTLCMEKLTVDEVFHAFEKMVQKNNLFKNLN